MLYMSKQPLFTPSMRTIILHGKDHFLMARYTEMLAEVLLKEFGDIEKLLFDGSEVSLSTVLDEARTLDLFMRHKLIVVDNSDTLITSSSKEKLSPRRIMEKYAESPNQSATILLRSKTWRVGKLDKVVSKKGLVYKMQLLDESSCERWCIQRCKKEYSCDLDPKASKLLVSRIGLTLTSLDNELKKLAAKISPKHKVQYSDVAEMVGLSREEQAWEIQSALLSGNANVAMTKLGQLLQVSRQPRELLMWSVVDLTRRLNSASNMLDNGISQGEIRKSLKLFGNGGNQILVKARNLNSGDLTNLFAEAVEVDFKTKTGLLDGTSGLECLALKVCETLA